MADVKKRKGIFGLLQQVTGIQIAEASKEEVVKPKVPKKKKSKKKTSKPKTTKSIPTTPKVKEKKIIETTDKEIQVNLKGQNITIPKEDLVTGGTFACSGCGAILGTKLALKALGSNTIMINPAGCMTLTATWPFTPYKVPWVHSAIENAGATATGVLMALKAQGLDKKVNVLAFAGDGASYDIGLQALSGFIARKEHIIYICYNNSSFANTGFQHSSATPYGARTKTSEPGKCCPLGNTLPRKNLAKMMAMNGAEYVATASVAYPIDFINKVKKATKMKGPVFIDLLTHCIPGWLHADGNGIQVGLKMVESGMWPLYEIINKKVTISHKPKMIPIKEAFQLQGRFKHLTDKHIKQIQGMVNKEWELINSGKFWESEEY